MKKTMLAALMGGILLPAMVGADTLTFKKSRALDPEGKEKKVTLMLGDDSMTIHRKKHPEEVFATFRYEDITSMEYERAKSSRLKTAIFLSPLALFSKGKKHWLTIQYKNLEGKGNAIIMRLDKKEYRAVLGEVESRAPVELKRVETN
jgi:hypothetical protein